MLRLNLLPWRERHRLAMLRRLRVVLIGSALLALCTVILVDQLLRQRGQQQLLANASRQAALVELDEQLEPLPEVQAAHAKALDQLAALASLRADQTVLPALFADLERAMPGGIQLTELKVEGERLQIVGLAASSAVVAHFMRELERSTVLREVQVRRMKSLPDGDEFLLTARLLASWS